ncbi:IS30 family transposase [Patescibacteria group bacterium]|nr:IS30 family transposase [Candidatus Falkowbacteria bacterium]MBU4073415.1 IS30 family transposase [Patescibacteria group bacterium]MBU4375842.1 IS30 family transposase [Patescibacteria group bacterium]MCG2695603.1 IS30 family transposase [Candidatus Parcubacteria bacterium]MCG2697539.1 IS30 family transposase [Candidatus Parcubacteria bacterium]
MKNYKRLSDLEREEISRMLSQGCSFQGIAKQLNRHVSTVSREVGAGSCNKHTYRAAKAQNRARRNAGKRKVGRFKLDGNQKLKFYICEKLKLKWSPVQIAEELKKDYPDNMDMRISPEAIYTYIYVLPRGALKKELTSCLRQNRKRRHKQSRGFKIERKIEDMLSIEERPKEVEDRIIPGHWEGDLIIGKNNRSALGTLVERTTRTTILVPVKSKEAKVVAKSFAKEVKKLPQQMKLSMTYDQGREMAKHKLFTDITGVKVYFAHPRSPWERGTNENTNGLIRQFFPKGTDFNKVSRYEVKKAQHLLNGRPRKVLGFQKPYEVFNQLINQRCCVRS